MQEDLACNITSCYKKVTRRKHERNLEVKYINPEIKIPIGALDNTKDIAED